MKLSEKSVDFFRPSEPHGKAQASFKAGRAQALITDGQDDCRPTDQVDIGGQTCTRGQASSIADRIAAKTLGHLRRNPEQHQLLAENLASYVSHLKAEFQAELEHKEGQELLDRLRSSWDHGEHRWVKKICRDLDSPYSDGEVQKRFEALESVFQSESQRLVAEHIRSYPAQIFVTGSLVKGRLGANSDIDAIGLAEGPYRPPADSDVHWMAAKVEGKEFLLKSFADTRAVEPGQSLLPLYRQALAERGLQLNVVDGNRWHIERRSYPERKPEVQARTGMIWSWD